MDTRNCPYCKEPINGRTCGNCGENWRDANTVTCSDCGDTIAEEKATLAGYSAGVGMKEQKVFKCWDCE